MTENIETILLNEPTLNELEQERQDKKAKYKNSKKLYNAKRYEEKKDEIKLKSAIYYKNRTDTDDTYKKMKLEKQNERNRLKRIGKEPAKMGRPKKTETEEPKPKKPQGRPKKYF
jgi:hypothetical protein